MILTSAFSTVWRDESQRLKSCGFEKSVSHERPDAEVLAYAAAHQLITLSHDVNTMPAAAYARMAVGQTMHGLVLVRQRSPYRRAIEDLVMIAMASEAEEWINMVRFLPL
jgi:hypothetical protein